MSILINNNSDNVSVAVSRLSTSLGTACRLSPIASSVNPSGLSRCRAPEPGEDFSLSCDGKDVVLQSLRQFCVFREAKKDRKPWVWWDSVADFNIRSPEMWAPNIKIRNGIPPHPWLPVFLSFPKHTKLPQTLKDHILPITA
ncbi:vacuolar-sorting receptor [Striga asiatica]|uniref:Vacuolar-sorting receptor n=1 Tax=Striga asiatica TaxID=4170 RepID=A0A5A7QK82_STRAF|nr:vacuolar-sorting receptor [Striga asiatica]